MKIRTGLVLTLLAAVAACGQKSKGPEINGHRAYRLTFSGIDEGGADATAIRQALESHADLDTVAWRGGACYCFLVADSVVTEQLQASLVERLGGRWTPSKIDYLPSTTRFGTASGTKRR